MHATLSNGWNPQEFAEIAPAHTELDGWMDGWREGGMDGWMKLSLVLFFQSLQVALDNSLHADQKTNWSMVWFR